MASPQHIPLVEITRGNIVESVHYGSLCAAHTDGSLLFSLGDITTKFFLRSSSKPFQALAFFERGGAEYYHLDDKDIALICSSHSGTDAHIQALETLQRKVGIDESNLQCGAHPPYSQKSTDQLLVKGITPHTNHNNCSGKHTGMLAFAKMIGAPLENYLELSHPVQQAILHTFAEMCGLDISDIELGIDGCTAPVFAVPLPNTAAAYARLCQPEGLTEERAKACRLITTAMVAHPDMVAGPERFDFDGMAAGKGAFISKVGAEGYRSIGILPGKAIGIDSSLGITMKISDGDPNLRAGAIVAMAVLKALKVLDNAQCTALKVYDRRPVFNWRGKEVGEIRPTAELIQALVTVNR
jgi:L-asparaginase II